MIAYTDQELAASTARPAISKLLTKTSTGPSHKAEKDRNITKPKFNIILIE